MVGRVQLAKCFLPGMHKVPGSIPSTAQAKPGGSKPICQEDEAGGSRSELIFSHTEASLGHMTASKKHPSSDIVQTQALAKHLYTLR